MSLGDIDIHNTDPEYWDNILNSTEGCALDPKLDDTAERSMRLLEGDINIEDIRNDIQIHTEKYGEIEFLYNENTIGIIDYERNDTQLYINFIGNLNMSENDYELYNVGAKYRCILGSDKGIRIRGLVIFMYSELIHYMKSLNMTEFAGEIDNIKNIDHAQQLLSEGFISSFTIENNEKGRDILIEKI